jgi:hypothetical protein
MQKFTKDTAGGLSFRQYILRAEPGHLPGTLGGLYAASPGFHILSFYIVLLGCVV